MRRSFRLRLLVTFVLVLVVVGALLVMLQRADAPDSPSATAAAISATTDAALVTLVPFTHADIGVRGIRPDGWSATDPGVFVSPNDDANFVIQSMPRVPYALIVPVILSNMNASGQAQVMGTQTANDITWTHYSIEVDGFPVDFALGQVGSATLMLLVQSPPSQRGSFYEVVFLPALNALTPLE